MPDAEAYGDRGSDTLGNIAKQRPLRLPNLCTLGLANIKPIVGLEAVAEPRGAFGKCALASPGKDPTTGHWERAGINLDKPLPLFPNGFPPEIMEPFAARIARRALSTQPASATATLTIIPDDHIRTELSIVDSS